MKKLTVKFSIVFGFFMAFALPSLSAELTSEEDSAKLVENLSGETIRILTSESSKQEKQSQIRAILVQNLDIERIGNLIVGKAIRKADDDQKAAYKAVISEYLEIKYSRLLSGYNGQSIKIVNTGRAGKSDALVNTHIIQEGSEPVLVSWRVSNKREKLMVLDVVVESISMLRTERQQFQSVLQSQKMSGLIKTLETKVAEMQAKS